MPGLSGDPPSGPEELRRRSASLFGHLADRTQPSDVRDRTREELVRCADQALYAAKDAGRDQVRLLASEYVHLQTGYFRRQPGGNDGAASQ